MNKIPLYDDEEDTLTGWRKLFCCGKGCKRKLKRGYNKKLRKKAKELYKEELYELFTFKGR